MKLRNKKYRFFCKAEEIDAGDGGDTGADDDTGGGGSGGESNTFPDTWRETYAGEDEGKLSKLSRYASPNAAFDALISAQTKISSGDYKSTAPFPGEGSDDEKSVWRSDNGIPESADKYELTLADGLVIGENDKPVIDGFLAAAHNANMSPKDATAAVEWYYQNQEIQAQERAEADDTLRVEVEDTLRAEWGGEYRANLNRINGLLDTAPEGVKDKILSARFQDGTPLGSDIESLKFLIDMAVQINPATTLVPGAGDNIAGAISDELANLEKLMGDRTSDYWKGPKAESNQKRYLELTRAKLKMK